MSNAEVVHHPERCCFVINSDGIESVLQYRRDRNDVDFTRTYVPPELRGRGLAEKLVRHGLHWASAEHLNIRASCWYVAKFLR